MFKLPPCIRGPLAFLVTLFEALLCWRLFFCRGELFKEKTAPLKGPLPDELNPPLMNFYEEVLSGVRGCVKYCQ